MESGKTCFEGKTDRELEEVLQAYLIGRNPASGEAIVSICKTLAGRKDPAADPTDIYRSQLAACFPEAMKANC